MNIIFNAERCRKKEEKTKDRKKEVRKDRKTETRMLYG